MKAHTRTVRRTYATVVPLTSTIRGILSEVSRSPGADGVHADCVVNADKIQTIRKTGLGTQVTHLSHERMHEARAAIEFALGFDSLT